MKKRFTEEQIIGILKEAEAGRRRQAARPVSDNYLGRSTGVVVAG
ncbi:hypothetical protein [Burkholderia contaminans]